MLNNIDIFLPSHRRAYSQHTLANLPKSVVEHIQLVVQDTQAKEYEAVADMFGVREMIVLPKHITSLSPTYEHMIHTLAFEDKMFILDDDLTFSYRADAALGDTKLTRCNGDPVLLDMFNILVEKLDTVPAVGVSARAGNNRVECKEPNTWMYNTRMMCLTGYRTEIVQLVKSNRVKCRDDFDRHLQLLKMGHQNSVLYDFAHDQSGGSNSSGGCSEYRDSDMLHDEALKLEQLHPGLVKAVERKTKSDWGVGGVRTDVRIQWKKAFDMSQGVL